ncbi:DUF305 domain-containing protein [Providencia vermicola]|uniref:CopM family metallochaperone n=1 Tax=Providencia TaxID=586 RepID=UPI0022B7183F|nr:MULTISPECIES: DUF305 domain-containing protein [Providencia]ELR5143402.1 DUF305 domain-containing protein [Providencia stuartii]WBA55714.1 DUF305 domain-containing protein [Providencia sp. 21OH12SH02B-Prov]WER20834.1 DUF305 domain-containing protein [Providencia stuartii]WER24954.1 DUF305 domain-containing protein [Providencia stuartii]WER29044.1 DUF305 domain-containing protein [Providencia stuartii]
MKKILPIATLIAASVSLSAFANSGHSMHMSSSTTNEMQKELNQSMDKMHSDMAKSMNEQNADVAFAQGMIAHHLGAIEMAKIELKYGTDPEMKKLAEQIINAQGPEIEQMQKWLEKNKDEK